MTNRARGDGSTGAQAASDVALPIRSDMRILEIGCGPRPAARAVADRLTTGHILAIDRSAAAIRQLAAGSSDQLVSGRLSARQVAIEDFVLAAAEDPFHLVFAIRVGALDGRHPRAGRAALARIADATIPGAGCTSMGDGRCAS